ncbi:MAG: winged helix-turn-helix transcriptional regulator [Dehalococcoidia bacterium]
MTRMRRGKELDRIDHAILRLLREDVRRPNQAIARELGISHITVRDRIGRLLQEGYIRLLPVADPRAFGYEREVEILLNLEPQAAWPLAEDLAREPAVRRLAIVTGGFDMTIGAVFRSEAELYGFLRRVAERPGVRAMQTQHVAQVYRHEHDWLPAFPEPDGSGGDGQPQTLALNTSTLDPVFLAGLQLAGRWLVALIEADVEQLTALSDDEIVFDVLPPTPLSGHYAGIQALAQHAITIRREFPISSAHIVRARPGSSRDELFVRWNATAVQEDGTVQHGDRLMHAALRDNLMHRVVDSRAAGNELAAIPNGWLETEPPNA